MTTIAYKNGILAADCNCSSGGLRIHRVRKIFRLEDDSLLGFAGDLAEGMKLVDWLDDGADLDKRPGLQGVQGILIKPSGRATMYEFGGVTVYPRSAKYLAIGTGGAVALGAMFHGASAAQAVRAAIEHDDCTRGPVMTMRLKR